MNLMNSAAKPIRNFWPHAIIAWFVIFASAMAAWIAVAVRQDMDLVRSDYYEEEVRFQQQLDRLNRTSALSGEFTLRYDAAKCEVTLRLPAAHLAPRPVGQLHFYRPSDAALDFQVPLAVDAGGLQRIGTSKLRGGLWKIRLQWSAANRDYFFEQTLVVDEAERHSIAAGTGTN
jgi:hypothetical protein